MRLRDLIILTVVFCSLYLPDTLAQMPSDTLSVGKPVERELSGGGVHSYSVNLKEGEFVHLVVEQRGIDVSVSVLAPGGKTVREVDGPFGPIGPEPVFVIAKEAGSYRIEIKAVGKVGSGDYAVKVVRVQSPDTADLAIMAALDSFDAALALETEATSESSLAAISKFKDAAKLLDQTGQTSKEADAYRHMANLLADLGENERSGEAFAQGLALSKKAGDKGAESYLLNDMANLYAQTGDFIRALSVLEQALAIRKSLNDRRGLATTTANIGAINAYVGKPLIALEYLGRATEINREFSDAETEAVLLTNMASINNNLGEIEKSINLSLRALSLLQALNNQRAVAVALTSIGKSYSHLGRFDLALDYFRQALDATVRSGDKSQESFVLSEIGQAMKGLGQVKESLPYQFKALEIARSIGNKQDQASFHTQIGAAYGRLSDFPRSLEHYELALALCLATINRTEEALIRADVAGVYARTGDRRRALASYFTALTLARGSNIKKYEAQILGMISQILLDMHKPRHAIFFLKQSVATYQSLRSKINKLNKDLQKSYLRYIEANYRSLARALINEGRHAEAQQILNIFKDQQYFDFDSRVLPEQLALTGRENSLRVQFDQQVTNVAAARNDLDKLVLGYGDRQLTNDEHRVRTEKEAKLASATSDYEAFLTNVETQFSQPQTIADTAPEVDDLAEMQTVLAEASKSTGQNAVAVYTLVGENDFQAIVVTPNSIDSATSSISAGQLNKKAQLLWNLLKAPKYDPRPAAKELYDIIFAPIEKKLPPGTRTILWSLDGNLRYVPMAALFDGRRYLAERYENVIFTRSDKERMKREVSDLRVGTGLGSSEAHSVDLLGTQFNASALPSVKAELDRIFLGPNSTGILAGSVLEDSAFTKAAMIKEMKIPRPLVHIASHFKFEPGDEARSFLLMGDGTPFTLDEMKKETDLFKGVDLLTLSACETAAQKPDANGREVDGFAELAQRLGAGAVMASLWEVSDDSTAELMTRFYRTYRGRSGVSKASALRRAQLALLTGQYREPLSQASRQLERQRSDASSPTDASKLKLFRPNRSAPYSHPYYWSPFVLIGNWK